MSVCVRHIRIKNLLTYLLTFIRITAVLIGNYVIPMVITEHTSVQCSRTYTTASVYANTCIIISMCERQTGQPAVISVTVLAHLSQRHVSTWHQREAIVLVPPDTLQRSSGSGAAVAAAAACDAADVDCATGSSCVPVCSCNTASAGHSIDSDQVRHCSVRQCLVLLCPPCTLARLCSVLHRLVLQVQRTQFIPCRPKVCISPCVQHTPIWFSSVQNHSTFFQSYDL